MPLSVPPDINPGVRDVEMAYYKDRLSYKIAIAAIIAALYATMVWVLAPISFFTWQVRIADCLIPQTFIFGFPCVIGLTLGGFLGNLMSPYPIDPIVGPLANFLAGFFGYLIEKRNHFKGLKRVLRTQIAITIQTLTNTFVVGTILGIVNTGTADLSVLAIWWIGILIGSLMSMNLLGFLIYEALRKTNLFTLESKSANLDNAVQYIKRQFALKIIKIKC